jgi:hypothetical protein
MNRRTFLTLSAVGTSQLIGTATAQYDGTAGVRTQNWPNAEAAMLDGWTEYTRGTYPLSATFISQLDFGLEGEINTIVYENSELREQISHDTAGRFDTVMMAFFTSKITLNNKYIGQLVPLGKVTAQIRKSFHRNVSEAGISEIEFTGTTKPDDNRIRTLFTAVNTLTEPSPSGRGRQETGGPSGPTLPVEGFIDTWKVGGDVCIAGGAYPAVDELVVDRPDSLNFGDGDYSIRIDRTVRVPLNAEQYRETLEQMVVSVE